MSGLFYHLNRQMLVAVIPVKELSRGKARLKPLLSAQERHLLCKTMLEDVLAVVTTSPLLDRVLVITSDAEAAVCARQYGAEIIGEVRQVRQSRSVEAAAAICRESGAEAMLTIPLDVPRIRANDLDRIVEHGSVPRGIVLVPSRNALGTNALLARPPEAIPFRFGYDSFQAHRREAEAKGLPCAVCELPNLGLDIDEVDDLRCFIAQPGKTRTDRLLHRLGIGERLGIETGV
ncbi:2-phospho-L-lactate guanylyltransferase [Candidatus Methylomirabilis sp.]|uniref:2-phospho-L-lactate guanylyltransferase n=1 Tax=Candidatus Methylomirabilis sp. TaxID=2032687 RepID=UPI002A5E4D63|nr:2-phospho-L-lactate guanylyltransferase [Candidatus Methylomirabilis sp.]